MYYSGEPFMSTSIVMSVYISIYLHGTLDLEVKSTVMTDVIYGASMYGDCLMNDCHFSSSTRHSTQVVLTVELLGVDYMEERTIYHNMVYDTIS